MLQKVEKYNGTQIKTVPMKEKIKALFKEYYNDETMPVVELEDKVLDLFDVVGQSEQLVCYKKCGDTQPYNDICLNCGSSINYNAN